MSERMFLVLDCDDRPTRLVSASRSHRVLHPCFGKPRETATLFPTRARAAKAVREAAQFFGDDPADYYIQPVREATG
jgi:hypothetical protein